MHTLFVAWVLAACAATVAPVRPPSFSSSAGAVAAARDPWQTDLIDLDGPARVRDAFNADAGRMRVLLTFSPT